MGELARAWIDAVAALGGDPTSAAASGADAERRYAHPARGYHGPAHILSVLADAAALGAEVGLDAREQACVAAAACAHDVVYDGVAGQDERRSADWARAALLAAGADPAAADRVAGLVLATAEHVAPPGDDAAAVLLDADLAILAADPDRYRAYVDAVRGEYAHLSDAQWRTGRSAVLAALAERPILYHTEAARTRWDAAARAALRAELTGLRESSRR